MYMDFLYFITNNKSGHKTKESWFSKNHSDEYEKIISYCSKFEIPTFKEKIWFYYHNLNELPKCCGCGINVPFSGRFDRGYQKFCSLKCANDNGNLIEKVKKTNQIKYGVDFYTESNDFMSKGRQTKMERYGDENYNNVNKIKNTKKERYNNENYNNISKMKKTSTLFYGVNNPSKSKIIKDRIKKTNNRIYGHNSPTQSPIIKQKLKNTILDKIKKRFDDNEFVDYNFELTQYTLNCNKCGNSYIIPMGLYNERRRFGNETCTNCSPIGVCSISRYEIELTDKLRNFDIISNDRKILNGKELDVYIPSNNLAIEINGLYWHSDVFKDKDYHINKTKLCQSKGVKLIHIFEDEWLNHKDIVISIINNRLGVTTNKMYARKCEVKIAYKVVSLSHQLG